MLQMLMALLRILCLEISDEAVSSWVEPATISKHLALPPFPHQRKISTEGQYLLNTLGRNTDQYRIWDFYPGYDAYTSK